MSYKGKELINIKITIGVWECIGKVKPVHYNYLRKIYNDKSFDPICLWALFGYDKPYNITECEYMGSKHGEDSILSNNNCFICNANIMQSCYIDGVGIKKLEIVDDSISEINKWYIDDFIEYIKDHITVAKYENYSQDRENPNRWYNNDISYVDFHYNSETDETFEHDAYEDSDNEDSDNE